MEQLVDIVHFLHMEIHTAFGTAGMFLRGLNVLEVDFDSLYIPLL